MVRKKKYIKREVAEENTDMSDLEVTKMKQGMTYSPKEKTIILNVFKYFKCQYPDKCVTDLVRRTAKATGCSEKSVFQFRKEENSKEGFKQPVKTKIRRNININSRDIKYDSTVRTTIRHVIYDLQFKNIVPSLNTILKSVNADTHMPKFSLMTLRRLMFDMGFSYQKNGNKSILVEKPDNRLNILNGNDLGEQLKNQPPLLNSHMNKPLPVPPAPDLRLISDPMHKPMHMAPMTSLPPPHHDSNNLMMPPPLLQSEYILPHSHNMLQKTMPVILTPRRDMMPPPSHMASSLPPTMDMHRKRDPMQPWMHGIIKQGQ